MTVNIEICHRGANKHTMMMRFDHQPLQYTDKISNKINLCYYFTMMMRFDHQPLQYTDEISNKINLCYYFKFSQEGFLFLIMIVFESFFRYVIVLHLFYGGTTKRKLYKYKLHCVYLRNLLSPNSLELRVSEKKSFASRLTLYRFLLI